MTDSRCGDEHRCIRCDVRLQWERRSDRNIWLQHTAAFSLFYNSDGTGTTSSDRMQGDQETLKERTPYVTSSWQHLLFICDQFLSHIQRRLHKGKGNTGQE